MCGTPWRAWSRPQAFQVLSAAPFTVSIVRAFALTVALAGSFIGVVIDRAGLILGVHLVVLIWSLFGALRGLVRSWAAAYDRGSHRLQICVAGADWRPPGRVLILQLNVPIPARSVLSLRASAGGARA
jgi:hypothetical protein